MHIGVGFLRASLCGFLVVFLTHCGKKLAVGDFGAKFDNRLDQILRDEMAAQRIPGVTAAVATRGELRWSKGFGVSDVENAVPARPETVFRIASISKTFTATAVMQLAEQGRLDLDAPIQTYCPAFPVKPWAITARQLLAHVAGVRHYNPAEYEHSNTRHYTNLVDTLAIFKDDPLVHEPGTAFTYTTYGYSVLGCAVEGVAGVSFVDYLRAHVFAPAALRATQVDDSLAILPHRAQGYQLVGGVLLNSDLADTSNKIPGGGLASTAEDLVRYALALRDGTLVRATTLALMTTEQRTRDGKGTEYGLGWQLGSRNGLREIYHSGGQERVSTLLYTLPDKEITIAVLTNLEQAGTRKIVRRIADLLLQ